MVRRILIRDVIRQLDYINSFNNATIMKKIITDYTSVLVKLEGQRIKVCAMCNTQYPFADLRISRVGRVCVGCYNKRWGFKNE